MSARRGAFRSGGLRPFGGGFIDSNAAFALPAPLEPITPPTRGRAQERGTRGIPQVVLGIAPAPPVVHSNLTFRVGKIGVVNTGRR